MWSYEGRGGVGGGDAAATRIQKAKKTNKMLILIMHAHMQMRKTGRFQNNQRGNMWGERRKEE